MLALGEFFAGRGLAPLAIEVLGQAAADSPSSAGTLMRYPGHYAERRVTLRDGRLFYSGGAYPDSPLTPMTERLFEVATEPTAPVRFDDAGSGRAARIVVLYSDGSADQAARVE